MRRPVLAAIVGVLVLALLLAGGLWLWLPPSGRQAVSAAAVPIGGPFSLVDQDGRAVTERDFAGKWMLIYFGYTYCPDVCPLGLTTVAEALDRLPETQQDAIVPVLVTVDPERDTPAVLKDYVAAFGPRFKGLTGSPEAVQAALKSWRVYSRKAEVRPDGGYLVDHSTFTYLMSPDGAYATHFSHGVSPEEMAQRLGELVAG
jgi:protein SCO1/2